VILVTTQATKIILLCATVLATVAVFILSQARFLMVTRTSMKPTITQNNIVLMLPVNPDKLKLGDKIYQIMHRVVEVNKDSLVTKGDALSTVDRYDARQDVVGVIMMLKISYAEKFVRFMHTLWGYVLFILMPSIALMVFEIR